MAGVDSICHRNLQGLANRLESAARSSMVRGKRNEVFPSTLQQNVWMDRYLETRVVSRCALLCLIKKTG